MIDPNGATLLLEVDPLSELEVEEMIPYVEQAVDSGLLSEPEAIHLLAETLTRNIKIRGLEAVRP
jgi:hypothetical protein